MKKILFAACLTAMVSVGAAFAQNIDTSKPLPAEYFHYDLDDSGDGIVIFGFSSKVEKEFATKYKNSDFYYLYNFSVLNIPSEIEGLPVTEVRFNDVSPIGTFAQRGRKGDDIIPWDLVIIPDGVSVNTSLVMYLPTIYTKKLILGKNLKFPRSYEFYKLEEFVVPESVTELGYYGDVQFTTAVIPEHINVIRGGIGGANLTDIIFHDNVYIAYRAKVYGKFSIKTRQKIRKLTSSDDSF
ncbi:hypothetical protein [Treponema pedis]|uniref:Uncharacterized protein n=1 Tax=Treponema pedis TaxID=409322 RepID=A0A7S6WR31_9SPIR|nr:hypothetical protein [Treponema pedis]QOW61740.1 hypothetical protein IFE08_05040 [Treponema pedis]